MVGSVFYINKNIQITNAYFLALVSDLYFLVHGASYNSCNVGSVLVPFCPLGSTGPGR